MGFKFREIVRFFKFIVIHIIREIDLEMKISTISTRIAVARNLVTDLLLAKKPYWKASFCSINLLNYFFLEDFLESGENAEISERFSGFQVNINNVNLRLLRASTKKSRN